MSAKRTKKNMTAVSNKTASRSVSFMHKTLVHILGWMSVLISISFFTATYDTAQVKLTLFQVGAFLLLALFSPNAKILLRAETFPFYYRY